MIDSITVFTKAGIKLWSYNLVKIKGDPIDTLIKTVLLEERSGETHYQIGDYKMKWLIRNELDMVFVVLYPMQDVLQMSYLDSLL